MVDFKNLPTGNKKGGFVYILNMEGRIKIGKTTNARNRIKQIRNMSGFHITECFVSPECSNYSEIESNLHGKFKSASILGEWFDVSFEKAVEELKQSDFQITYNTIEKETRSIRQQTKELDHLDTKQ